MSRLIKPWKSTAVQAKLECWNFHWLLESEAVTDERSGSLDAGTLGYSSSGRGHWPLTEAGSRSEMLNSYWPSAHPWSLGAAEWGAEF